MSNEIQLEELETNKLKEISEENKNGEQEDILEKINKQIEFLKNKFEVAKMVDSIEEENKIDLKKAASGKIILQDDNNNEIINAIKDEK